MNRKDRKPDTRTAMRQLIDRIRKEITFNLPEDALCGEACEGCSSKLLIYLETELDEWEARLADGAIPNFGDLYRLAEKGKKTAQVLHRNGLLEMPLVS